MFSIRADSYTLILLSATTSPGLRGRPPKTALNMNLVSVVTPLRFIIQVNTQVLVTFHHLNIHHQLFGSPCMELEAVLLAPIHKALGPFPRYSLCPHL